MTLLSLSVGFPPQGQKKIEKKKEEEKQPLKVFPWDSAEWEEEKNTKLPRATPSAHREEKSYKKRKKRGVQ